MAQANPITTPTISAAAFKRTQQRMQENESDRATRVPNDFAGFEKTMPCLPHRFDCSLIDRLTSYLGSHNPFSHPVVDGKQTVWLLDTVAWRRPEHQSDPGGDAWNVEIVAAFFSKNSGKDVSSVVADLGEKIGIAKGDAAEQTMAERLQPFLDTVCPARTVRVDLDQHGTATLGPSGRDGISNDTLTLSGHHRDGDVLEGRSDLKSVTPLTISFAEPTGWAVISDVDDTIKKTMTSSPVGILKTTFAEEPEAISGMPELYAHLRSRLSNPPFWYLSASPYNLYPFLRTFRDAHYPPGPLYLREASWMTLAGLLTNLTQGTQAYKDDRMEMIHKWFPSRTFICIGDSTQTDPESYGDMYRKYPAWIGAIFIRKVTDIAEVDEGNKNNDDRFQKAFKDVPDDLWHVFEDPAELYERVDRLVTT